MLTWSLRCGTDHVSGTDNTMSSMSMSSHSFSNRTHSKLKTEKSMSPFVVKTAVWSVLKVSRNSSETKPCWLKSSKRGTTSSPNSNGHVAFLLFFLVFQFYNTSICTLSVCLFVECLPQTQLQKDHILDNKVAPATWLADQFSGRKVKTSKYPLFSSSLCAIGAYKSSMNDSKEFKFRLQQ